MKYKGKKCVSGISWGDLSDHKTYGRKDGVLTIRKLNQWIMKKWNMGKTYRLCHGK